MEWLAKASQNETSLEPGLCAKGHCYESATGGIKIKNAGKAKELHSAAAERGYIPAMYRLAWILCSEAVTTTNSFSNNNKVTHVHKDERKLAIAVNLLSTCSEAGYVPGMSQLAYCYDNGFGVDRDKREAFKLYKMAAEKGDAWAKKTVGRCYETDNNLTEARVWYKAAQKQGYDVSNELSRTAIASCCSIV